MRAQQILAASIVILLAGTTVYSQDPPGNSRPDSSRHISNPFAKGKNGFQMERNLSYRNRNEYFDGDKTGHLNDLSIGWHYTRFLGKGFGIGTDFNADFSGDLNGVEIRDRNWMLYGTATYGMNLGDNSNMYLQLGVGYGKNKTIFESGSTTTEQESSAFGVKADIGFPMRMGEGSNAYFTPRVFAKYTTEDFDDGIVKEFKYGVGVNLEGYVHDDEIMCECKRGFPLSRNLYRQGTSYIGYYSKGMASFSNITTDYDNFGEEEEDYNRAHLKATYGYYITDYVALGLGVSVRNQVQKNEEADFRYQWTSYGVMPHVTLNTPVNNGWNNFFLQFEGGIGSQKFEYEQGSNTSEEKYNTSSWSVGLGYNHVFTPRISLTAIAGYDSRTLKDEDDQKETVKGFGLQIGVQTYLGVRASY